MKRTSNNNGDAYIRVTIPGADKEKKSERGPPAPNCAQERIREVLVSAISNGYHVGYL